MDIMEMMQKAMAESDDTQTLSDVQIVARLTDVVALLDVPHAFTRGQVLRHKFPSMATTKRASQPVTFMGYLATPIDCSQLPFADASDAHTNSAADVLDCRIMTMRDEAAIEHLANSQEYQPHPDFPQQVQ